MEVADDPALPDSWGPDQNIAWKLDVPGYAWSSPVVWGDRIYLLTAVPAGVSGPAQHQPRQHAQCSIVPDPKQGIDGRHAYIGVRIDRNTKSIMAAQWKIRLDGNAGCHTVAII